MDDERTANLSNWESRVPIHVASVEYDVDALARGDRRLSDVVAYDAPYLGDLRGLDVVHLQCHIGTDTISLARLGARVTGVDFSATALEAARDLARRATLDVTFVESELYGAPAALGETEFDLVYTGVGALCWLPDIRGWARVVAQLLRPGGRLYVRDGHPMMWSLGFHEFRLEYPYFERAGAHRSESGLTYAGEGTVDQPVVYEYNHGLGEIVQALIDAGMTVTRLVEHDVCEWQCFESAVFDGRWWRLPGRANDVPLMYTLEAVRG